MCENNSIWGKLNHLVWKIRDNYVQFWSKLSLFPRDTAAADWSNRLFVITVIQERNGCHAFGHHISVHSPSTVAGERHYGLGRPAGRPSVHCSSVRCQLTTEMCGSWKFESASVHRFWPKIRVRVRVHGKMQSLVRSQSASANDRTSASDPTSGNSLCAMQFIGGTLSTRYSLLDKITAGNSSVIFCYNTRINHSSFNVP